MNHFLLRLSDRDILSCDHEFAGRIRIPADAFFHAICASLQQKKNVIVTKENEIVETFSNKLWECHENYIWISHRALGPILGKSTQTPSNFDQLKQLLQSI